ncbi:TauD/TfdA family dioxygenase [Vreelandella sp. EE22]
MATDTLPPTPDYDAWPVEVAIAAVECQPKELRLTWQDGRVSRYHSVWLRENATDDSTVNPATRERILDLSRLEGWPTLDSAELEPGGGVRVCFATEQRTLRFHPGWLRAHDYSNGHTQDAPLVPVALWRGGEHATPDTLDGGGWLEHAPGSADDNALMEPLLESLMSKGLVRLRNLPTEPGSLSSIARRIGPVRPTNFGDLFDVKAKPNPDSNAYTSIALPPHVDLPTREYQPGLQLLHCLENSVEEGQAVMMDGFAIAQTLREEHPETFETLTTVRWCFANTSRSSDYVWHTPVIECDEHGAFVEVRIADFLRGPLQVDFHQVEPAYEALMVLQRYLRDPAFALRFTYHPGDLVIFDNRRLLHARDAFAGDSGHRWLQGCYLERDEVRSRYRMIQRFKREQRVSQDTAEHA